MFLIILTGILSLGIIPLLALEGYAVKFIFDLFNIHTVHGEYWILVLFGLCLNVIISLVKQILSKD